MFVFPVGMIECLILLWLCRCVLMSCVDIVLYVVRFTGACGVGSVRFVC